MIDPDLQTEAEQRAADLALALDSPEAIARALAAWLRQKMPERLAQAYWVSAEGDRDKGIEVRIYERKLPKLRGLILRLGGLIGATSAGLSVSTDVWRSANGATVALGVGAIAPYADLRQLSPVAVVALRF